jgi:hypothetical protein
MLIHAYGAFNIPSCHQLAMNATHPVSSIGSIAFIDSINQRYSSKRTTKELVKQALLLINAVSGSPKFQLKWLRRFGLDLDLFLRTMLECAPTTSSRRYVASAITGCSIKEWNSPETAENLRELAINWFGHLFWTCKPSSAFIRHTSL